MEVRRDAARCRLNHAVPAADDPTMAAGGDRAREERRGAFWAVIDLLWVGVLRFFGFSESGWFERATRRDLPLAYGLLRAVRRRMPWLLGPILLVVVGGLLFVTFGPPTHAMLRNDLDHARMPDGTRRFTIREGNVLCIGGCPAVTKVVVVAGSVAEWSDRWDQLLVAGGVRMGTWTPDGEGRISARDAHFHRRYFATVTEGPTVATPPGATAIDVPPGHVALVLRIEGTRESTPSV